MHKYFFILLTLVVFKQHFAYGKTQISTTDKDYADIPVRVYGYMDLLSYEEELLSKGKFDKDGVLKINLDIHQPQLVFIPLYSFHLVFYIEPNKNHHLKLPKLQQLQNAFERMKTYTGREIPLHLENKSLNNAIAMYDRAYNKLLRKYFDSIYQQKKTDILLQKTQQIDTDFSNSYFDNYKKYKEAYVYFVAGLQEEISTKYFQKQQPKIYNTAYVSLLKKITQPIAENLAFSSLYRTAFTKYKKAKTYKEIQEVATEITKTKNKEYSEHLLLYVLYQGIKSNTLRKENAVNKIQRIANESQYVINKKLANSLYHSLTKSKKRPAPTFNLKGEKHSLLVFIDTATDNSSLLQTIQDWEEKYKNAFNLLLIKVGGKSENSVKNQWKTIELPYYSYLLKDYQLGRFPYLVLVDKDGYITEETWQQFINRLD